MLTLQRITGPTTEPITLDQAKAHCRVIIDDDDALIATYIQAAREYCETRTGRAFIQQTWRLSLDHFPCAMRYSGMSGAQNYYRPYGPVAGFGFVERNAILLPKPRVIGVTSLTYLDSTQTRQTLDPTNYVLDGDSEPARIVPAYGVFWPYSTSILPNTVQVTYTAGYGPDATTVPASIQLAILLLVGHWYENREASILPTSGTGLQMIPAGVNELLADETVTVFTFEA